MLGGPEFTRSIPRGMMKCRESNFAVFDLSISNRLPLFSGVVTNEVSFVVSPLSKGESSSVNSRTSNCFSKSSETRSP